MNTTLQEYISLHFEVKEPDDLQKIASFFKSTKLKKGEYFLQTGKNCDKLSFIDSGILRIYVELEEKEITQWISTKGYFVTDIQSFIFNSWDDDVFPSPCTLPINDSVSTAQCSRFFDCDLESGHCPEIDIANIIRTNVFCTLCVKQKKRFIECTIQMQSQF